MYNSSFAKVHAATLDLCYYCSCIHKRIRQLLTDWMNYFNSNQHLKQLHNPNCLQVHVGCGDFLFLHSARELVPSTLMMLGVMDLSPT